MSTQRTHRAGGLVLGVVVIGTIVALLIWTLQRPATDAPSPPAERSWLVTGAEVLMPREGQLKAVKGMAVLGRGQVIEAIAPLNDLKDVPSDAQRIDGAGATLLPGLMDAWCSIKDPTDLDHALSAGVTTLRVMDRPSWLPRVLRQRQALGIPSPRCIAFGRDLRRHVARRPDKESLRGEALRRVIEDDVESQVRAGVAGFTLGHDASLEVLRLVLDATDRYRIPLSIRTPGRTSFRRVAFEGDSIGSLEAFLDDWLVVARGEREPEPPPSAEAVARNVALAIEARRTVLTGLIEYVTASRLLETEPAFLAEDFVRNRYDQVDEGQLMAKAEQLARLPPLTRVTWSQAAHQLRRNLPASVLPNLLAARPLLDQIVLQLDEAGAHLVVATGAGAPHVHVGRSVIDELILLHGAGLSAEGALTAATSNAARFLGTPHVGAVAVGRVADLVLVEGRPLEDLESLRRVRTVARAGLWNQRETIEARQAADRAQLDAEIDFIVTATIQSIRGPAEASAERLDLLVRRSGVTVRRETVESLRTIFRTADVFRPEHAAVLDEFLLKYFN